MAYGEGESMIAQRDYYQVLGLERDADDKTIKNTFRRLARRYHPDTCSEPDAEERFKEIAEAYGVLSDPAKRASYDAQGFAGVAGATAEDLWGGIDFADIFGPGVPVFGDLFERLFGSSAAAPPPGEDAHVDLALSLEQVLTGGKQTVRIDRPGHCPQCAGSGSRPGTVPRGCRECGGTGQRIMVGHRGPLMVRQVTTCPACGGHGRVIDQPCRACQGTGRAVQQDTVTIRIPPGIDDGTTLRLAGRGSSGPAPGVPPGDAYVTIRVRPDPRFTRVGADLRYDLNIQVPDATLGTTVTVPAPDGPTRVRVPPGTQTGTVLRIEGKGLPRYPGHGRGRLDVAVLVDIPRHLSPRQRQLYEQLRAEDGGAKGEAGQDTHRSGGRLRAWLHRGRAQGPSPDPGATGRP
jgi:molecular chaperone DnaJ